MAAYNRNRQHAKSCYHGNNLKHSWHLPLRCTTKQKKNYGISYR